MSEAGQNMPSRNLVGTTLFSLSLALSFSLTAHWKPEQQRCCNLGARQSSMALTSMAPAIQQQKRIFLLITEHAIPFRETQVLLRKELYLLAGM